MFSCAVMRTGVVSQAAGSAYLELGRTKVMAGVYGPRPSERREAFSNEGTLNVDVKLASFATRARGSVRQVRLLKSSILSLESKVLRVAELLCSCTPVRPRQHPAGTRCLACAVDLR